MFAALVEYEKGHGHCNVPHRWAENLKLGGWVNKQKIAKKNGKLSAERIRRLDGIEFVWDQLEAAWEEMFAALVKYKNVHGDCKVPQAWAEDRKLGKWLSHQRNFMRKGQLSKERIQRFNAIGFKWRLSDKH